MENDHDPNWHWDENYGWYWEEKKEPSKPEKTKCKPPARKSNQPAGATGSTEDKPSRKRGNANKKDSEAETGKKSRKHKSESASSKPPQSKDDAAKANKRSRSEGAKKEEEPKSEAAKEEEEPKGKKTKNKRSKVCGQQITPQPAPMTQKEQKKEILDFLDKARHLQDDNAKDELRKLTTDFAAAGYDCSCNIYWNRRGQQGVGVGVKSKSEGKDIAFFGYKSMCDQWIYAIAAAIMAAEIYATFLQQVHAPIYIK